MGGRLRISKSVAGNLRISNSMAGSLEISKSMAEVWFQKVRLEV